MCRLAAVLLLAAAGSAGAAPPDDVDDIETGDLAPERVTAKLVGTVVRIDARFELTAHGLLPAPGETRSFAIPERAVITAATARAGGQSHRLQLIGRTDADKKLEVLQEMPSRTGGRTSAIRLDAASSAATLDIAVPRRTHVQLDVTLEVPTCYANDARHIVVPPVWADRIGGAATQLTPAAAEVVDERCGESSSGLVRFAFAANALARRPSGEPRVGFHSARLPLGKRDIARLEVSLAKQLTDIPRDLHTVFVVDHSRSVSADEHAVQRAVIASYLRSAPRSRVQLVGYTRDARTQLPGWMLASQASTRIERHIRALAPRNGSNVDVGIATAASLLANATGTHRIVLFTDSRLAEHLTEEVTQKAIAAGLAPGTIVHVVGLGGFQPGVVRNDDHVLATLAKETTGIATIADVDDQGTIDALALVRPISLDNITFDAPGWDSPLFENPACELTLAEGSSCVFVADGSVDAGPIHVEADLWNRKITRDITPDVRGARSLARMLSTASGLPVELFDPIQNAAMAVNGAWSLLAMWGPRGGYADQESLGSFGFGRIGTSSSHTISHDVGTGTRARLPEEEVENQLGPAVRRCKPRGSISTTVELTSEEIVRVVVRPRDKRDGADIVACITEGIWDTMLSLADPPRHANVTVDFYP